MSDAQLREHGNWDLLLQEDERGLYFDVHGRVFVPERDLDRAGQIRHLFAQALEYVLKSEGLL